MYMGNVAVADTTKSKIYFVSIRLCEIYRCKT